MLHPAIGHLMGEEAAGVFQGKGLDVYHLGDQPGRFHGCLALIDVLSPRGHEQHVEHLGIAGRRAEQLEVEADFFHGEGDVLISLDLHLAFELPCREPPGHLDNLGDGRIATDGDRRIPGTGAGAFHRATNGFTNRGRIHNGLLVDRVRRRWLGGIAFSAKAPATLRQLDELDRGGCYVKAYQGPGT